MSVRRSDAECDFKTPSSAPISTISFAIAASRYNKSAGSVFFADFFRFCWGRQVRYCIASGYDNDLAAVNRYKKQPWQISHECAWLFR